MRIHSSIISSADIYSAADLATNHNNGTGIVRVERCAPSGSRKRAYKLDVILSGTSGRAANFGGGHMAASWDEWGIVLGYLFTIDPEMITDYYSSAEEFHFLTGSRYEMTFEDVYISPGNIGRITPLLPSDEMKRAHNWGMGRPVVTGTYSVAECTHDDCSAVRRWFIGGHSYADIAQVSA